MNKPATWLTTVIVATISGWAFGRVLAIVLFHLNLDYVVPVSFITSQGLRAGLLIGTFLGACAVVGRANPISRQRLFLGIVAVVAGALVFSALAGTAAYLLSKYHLLSLANAVNIGNPNRIFLCRGLQWGAVIGMVLSGIWAGRMFWHRRGVENGAAEYGR